MRKGRGRISGQHGDGVFKLRTLLLHQVELRLGGIEQRLLLRQVEPGGHTACVPILHQLQPLLLNRDRFLDDSGFQRRARAG